MSDDNTRLTIDVVDGVADVRLARPEKMNALDLAMFDALIDGATSLAGRGDVRCVVLSGEGRAFSAGLDLSIFGALADRGADEVGDAVAGGVAPLTSLMPGGLTSRAQQAVHGWTALPMPVIAAVHGVAFGGGVQLALGADLRIAHREARLSVMEIRWGLVPDMTGTRRLVELVGLDVAKELTFTGRTVLGDEALRLGLVGRLSDDPRAEAMALAREIAGQSPDAIRAAKRLFRAVLDADEATAYGAERHEMDALIGSPNQAEAVLSGLEKRAPVYRDAPSGATTDP